eukprot:m.34840 g.34840  ORF g.34840 m.34840 type:complete len:274 (-) comp8789_c0_seq1:1693-2514(-)
MFSSKGCLIVLLAFTFVGGVQSQNTLVALFPDTTDFEDPAQFSETDLNYIRSEIIGLVLAVTDLDVEDILSVELESRIAGIVLGNHISEADVNSLQTELNNAISASDIFVQDIGPLDTFSVAQTVDTSGVECRQQSEIVFCEGSVKKGKGTQQVTCVPAPSDPRDSSPSKSSKSKGTKTPTVKKTSKKVKGGQLKSLIHGNRANKIWAPFLAVVCVGIVGVAIFHTTYTNKMKPKRIYELAEKEQEQLVAENVSMEYAVVAARKYDESVDQKC